jgi:hypothetical protein
MSPTRREASRRAALVLLWAAIVGGAVLFAAYAPPAGADALDGVLEIRSAYVEVERSVFQLHARIAYPMTQTIRNALRDGVTLAFDLDARVSRDRRFWFDATIVDLTLRRELAYHTVSDRYVVRDVRSGDEQSYPTLDEALDQLGRVDGWPILVEPQLADGERYRVSVRAGIRRGRLPASLRALLFWTNDWHRVSEWYSWNLPT